MNRRKFYNRVLGWVLVLAMVIGMVPLNGRDLHVHAAESETSEFVETESADESSQPTEEKQPTEKTEQTTLACTCDTDDELIHATNCAVYIAPADPQCFCVEVCAAETLNVWCDVCGVQGADACQAHIQQDAVSAVYETAICDTASHVFADGICSECSTIGGYCGDENINSGKNLVWVLTQNNEDAANPTYTITISNIADSIITSGSTISSDSGNMKAYNYGTQPWDVYKTNITSVVIENGVTSLGQYAFYDYDSITKVTVPKSITAIGVCAFYECGSLTDIVLEEGLTVLGESMFEACESLKSVTVPSTITSFGNYAFASNSQLTKITFTDGLTTIGDYMFRYNTALEDIIIPNSVTTIGKNAFQNCESLKNIHFGTGVTTIGESAFSATAMESLNITSNIESIGPYAFASNQSLVTVAFAETPMETIAEGVFYKCTALKNVFLPDHVKTLGDFAFYECTALTEFRIPPSLTTIGIDVFYGCSNLVKFVVAADNATYSADEEGVLYSKDGKTLILYPVGKSAASYTIPETVTALDDYAFSGCANLKEIIIPDGVTSIGEGTFFNCTGITSLTVPDSVTSIGMSAFNNCTSLTEVILPKGIKEIPAWSFRGTAFETFIVPDTVNKIGDNAFYACNNLTTVIIPDSVTSLGEWVFDGCYSLKNVLLPATVQVFPKKLFGYVGLTVHYPGSALPTGFPDNVTVHLVDVTAGSAATCIGTGKTDAFQCSSDGCTFSYGGEEIPVDRIAHMFEEGVCTVCGKIGGYCGADTDGKNLVWTLDKTTDTVTISGSGAMKDFNALGGPWKQYINEFNAVVIEDGVTTVGLNAFSNCPNLVSVELGKDIETIKTCAFYECPGIEEIKLPSGLKSVGNLAFGYCEKITSLHIPAGFISMDMGAFGGMRGLTTITVDPDNTLYKAVDNVLFTADGKALMLYPSQKADETYMVPDGVVVLGYMAFEANQNIKTVILSDTVKEVDEKAFRSNDNLETVIIPKEISSIAKEAFYYCSKLKAVHYLGTKDEWDNKTKHSQWASPALDVHFAAEIEKAEANCTTAGHEAGIYCDSCAAYITGGTVLPINENNHAGEVYRLKSGTTDTIETVCDCGKKVYGTYVLKVPETSDYDGKERTAAVEKDGTALTDAVIVYKDADGKIVTSVKKAGTYTAEYTLGSVTVTAQFEIEKRPVTAVITVNDKDYDGKPTATVEEIVLSGVLNSDFITLENGTLTFADEKAGENKAVAFSGWTLEGTNADNYVLTAQPVNATATIRKAALTVTANPHTITYSEAPANAGVNYTGFVNGETVDDLGGTLAYEYSYEQYGDIGDDYTITPKGLTSDNYDITFASGKLTVTQKEIGIEWGKATFTYDGNAKVPAATATGAVNGDVIALTVEGAQTQASASSYTATVTGITGDKADNYKLPADVTTTFTISNAPQDKPDVSGTNETISGKADGTITGVDSTMEWRADGAEAYTAVADGATSITGLAPGTYYVRYAAKDNYNASEDAAVVITAGRKLMVIVPQSQTGYTLIVNDTSVKWNDSVELTFTLADGYSKTEAFAVKVNGSAVDLSAMGKYTVFNVQSDVAITVEGVADITAPEAEIKIEDNFWKTLLNNITFGKFFKDTQKVEITAADVNTGSGLDKIYYYLATEEVGDFTSVTWTEYTDAFDINPDNEYIIYAKATDNAGNPFIISSTGLVLDATKPAITGIENGGTYYGDITITAADKYLDTVTVDNGTVELTDGKYTIQADNKEHTVKATDKSGNVTEYKITVYKIHTVTYKADGVTVAEIPVNHGSDVTNVPKIPVKEGYTQTAPTWDQDGKNITDDTTINAVYTINEYIVTYRASGDTIAEIPVKHGSDVTNVPAIPEKTGYTQTAPTWERDGKNITEDTEINAVYVINKYIVTYKADGVTVDILAVNHGSNVTNVPAIPVKEGYTQTEPTWDNDGKNITDDTTINAVYTINKYTVTYKADGVTVDTETVEHGSDVTSVPKIPEKTGYTQTAPVWDKDGKNITDDTEINAIYTINKYTVTYKADGEVVDTQTVEHGGDAVAPAVPVKEGYDQTPGQWSHNGKNITDDTIINAVYSINGYNITVPDTQTGYTLSVDKTYVEWGSDAVLTFKLADGYSKTETFAVKVNGSAVELEEDGTYTIADIKRDAAITVEGVADITAPEATIKIGDNFWKTLLNNITFGKFFKETQKVEITAADVNTGSGLDKIYYYLATEEVTDLTSVVWTEYTGSFNIEPNAEVIIYAWAEDHAGNDKYISSEGLVLDSIAPVITGITDGTTYYGTVGYEVDETYVATVTDNDSEVTLDNGKATIAADGKAHVIIVTDKAGNTATVTVTVKPVEDIDDSITVDDSNVTSEDKEEIQGVIDSIDNILNDENSDLTEEEKTELEELREEAQNLFDKIAETEKAVEDAVTDADGFKADEVTSDDKDEIEDLIKEIEDLIASDNTTDEQKAELEDAKEALKDRVQEIEDAAQAVEDAKAPVKDITSDNVTADDSDELEKAKETLEELKEDSTYTEEEKTAIQAEIDRITELEEVIAETEEEVKDIEEKADALDPDKVTSSDKAEVEQFITEMEDKLSDPNMTEEQKERVEESIDEAEAIIEKIEADQKALEEALTDQKAVTEENVTGDDSEALADAKETLEELKQDDNYTVAEKEAIQEEIDRITELEEKIAEVAKEVSDLKEAADGYDKDTVTSKDKDALEDLIEDAEALLETDNLTDEQKETVEAVKADAEELVKEIEDAASDITTEDVKEVEDITSENVGLDDKTNLEEALEDLKTVLEEIDGNYTDEEKAAIEEDIARMEDALESIEKAEGVIDQITELPAAEDVETDDEDVVADVQEIVDAYDKLTDHEKSLIDEELISKLEDVQDKLSAYAIIKGADGSYTKGSSDGLEFTANGAFSKFTGIKVDGTVVAEDNYTAEAGSTVITLKASYLETLTTGKHELTAVYTDGDASCNFEVKAQVIVDTDDDTDGDDNSGTNDDSDKGVTSPDTGDHSNVGMWSILMMLSAVGIITIGLKKRKRY